MENEWLYEKWMLLDGFDNAAVSDHGRVMNTHTEVIKKPGINQQGIHYVGLIREGRQFKRSVAVLVAETFLDPPRFETFDTPIHLDGDKANCRADNLMWRPRYFAVKFHQQFGRDQFPHWASPIHILDTDEIFETPRDIAVRYGVLERDVHMAIFNETQLWPYGYDLRLAVK